MFAPPAAGLAICLNGRVEESHVRVLIVLLGIGKRLKTLQQSSRIMGRHALAAPANCTAHVEMLQSRATQTASQPRPCICCADSRDIAVGGE